MLLWEREREWNNSPRKACHKQRAKSRRRRCLSSNPSSPATQKRDRGNGDETANRHARDGRRGAGLTMDAPLLKNRFTLTCRIGQFCTGREDFSNKCPGGLFPSLSWKWPFQSLSCFPPLSYEREMNPRPRKTKNCDSRPYLCEFSSRFFVSREGPGGSNNHFA